MLAVFNKQELCLSSKQPPTESHVGRISPANPTQALSASLSETTQDTMECSRSQSKDRLQTFLAPRHLATLQKVQK